MPEKVSDEIKQFILNKSEEGWIDSEIAEAIRQGGRHISQAAVGQLRRRMGMAKRKPWGQAAQGATEATKGSPAVVNVVVGKNVFTSSCNEEMAEEVISKLKQGNR